MWNRHFVPICSDNGQFRPKCLLCRTSSWNFRHILNLNGRPEDPQPPTTAHAPGPPSPTPSLRTKTKEDLPSLPPTSDVDGPDPISCPVPGSEGVVVGVEGGLR